MTARSRRLVVLPPQQRLGHRGDDELALDYGPHVKGLLPAARERVAHDLRVPARLDDDA